LGNLVNRTVAMAVKYLDGKVPAPHPELDTRPLETELRELALGSRDRARTYWENYAPSRALEEVWTFVRGANRYVDASAPWTLAKDPAKKIELEHVVHRFLEAVLWAAYMVWPVMPQKAEDIVARLGLAFTPTWPETWGAHLPAGVTVHKGDPLFPRLDDAAMTRLLDKWLASTAG